MYLKIPPHFEVAPLKIKSYYIYDDDIFFDHVNLFKYVYNISITVYAVCTYFFTSLRQKYVFDFTMGLFIPYA